MSFIAITHSYGPQLCIHTPLSNFHCTVSEVKAPSGSQVCSECSEPVLGTRLGWLALPCPAQQLQGCCTCWCRPAVWTLCEEFGWVFCEVLDNRLWFYTSPATVSCISCCCKFGPGDSQLRGFTQNWTWVSAHSLHKKSSDLPLVIVFPLGL